MLYPTHLRREVPAWGNLFDGRPSFDLLFDRVSSRAGNGTASGWTPVVDIHESTDVVELVAELPGLEPENVLVSVEDGVLTISGEKKQERIEGKDDAEYHIVERCYGSFERRFKLPRTVEAEKINAAFANGVLKVSLPKAEAAKPRRIEVRVDEATGIK